MTRWILLAAATLLTVGARSSPTQDGGGGDPWAECLTDYTSGPGIPDTVNCVTESCNECKKSGFSVEWTPGYFQTWYTCDCADTPGLDKCCDLRFRGGGFATAMGSCPACDEPGQCEVIMELIEEPFSIRWLPSCEE
jgi:hypothetical protein